MSTIDPAFGNWLAGFTDGEGSFIISQVKRDGYYSYRPNFSITLRADDRPVIEQIAEVIGGSVHEYDPTGPGRRVVRLAVQSHEDCRRLVELFTAYPLRAKKARDFAIWSEAVELARGIQTGVNGREKNAALYAQLKKLKEKMAVDRS